ncbi:hypothetical protein BNJ_00181 [Kaumoebavirus]|uniref:hypothetical protein n=1 Tax=Kaumoebavirus TaxID=1859492 RepID=UPI0009C1E985|nr:hypothetical protein BNJ_00181 [Kaumoebavirus]ARA72012.1 hypothetical protein BNJ_00181 [Kaumoebavirus]
MSTIETKHELLLEKIGHLRRIIEILGGANALARIKKVEDNYLAGVGEILIKYYDITSQNLPTSQLDKEYEIYVNNEAVLSELAEMFGCYVNEITKSKDNALLEEVRGYKNKVVEFPVIRNDYSLCEKCLIPMFSFPHTSELKCDKCGLTKRISGMQLDENLPTETRSKVHNPLKFCKKWMNNIQAKENVEIPEKVKDDVKSCIVRDYTRQLSDGRRILNGTKNIKCWQYREYLKEKGHSDYNEHVPLIRKLLTGVIPPQFTYEEEQDILSDYAKAMKTLAEIKEDENDGVSGNNPYFPYTLYKIIYEKFLNRPEKRAIIECIHLQSTDTLIKHDIDWKRVCDKTGFNYRASDRSHVM